MTARCVCRFHMGCDVHDDAGRRWDSYTTDDMAKAMGLEFQPAPADGEWSCYCGRHDATDAEVPIGTPCYWERTSYEYDEWECKCAAAVFDDWVDAQSPFWEQAARQWDRQWRRQRLWARITRPILLPLISRGWWQP